MSKVVCIVHLFYCNSASFRVELISATLRRTCSAKNLMIPNILQGYDSSYLSPLSGLCISWNLIIAGKQIPRYHNRNQTLLSRWNRSLFFAKNFQNSKYCQVSILSYETQVFCTHTLCIENVIEITVSDMDFKFCKIRQKFKMATIFGKGKTV